MAFDLRTQRVNSKGQITQKNPYVLVIENGIKKFERPKGSGQWFSENGDPIRMEKETQAVRVVQPEKEKKTEMADLKADLLGEKK